MPALSLYAQIKSGKIKVNNFSGPVKRFWKHVYKKGLVHPVHGQCWAWSGALVNGYGRISVSQQPLPAHRYSWMLHYGQVPPGLYVLHKCDNRCCTNPEHLFLGTYKDNSADCVAKDRHTRGERHARARLTDELVREIRNRYRTERTTHRKLAAEYGIGQTTVHFVVNREAWKHVK